MIRVRVRAEDRGEHVIISEGANIYTNMEYIILTLTLLEGANIYPAEIEECLAAHPSLVDSAVFGLPDPEYGQQIHAAVQLKPGVNLTKADIQDWVKGKLASLKVPKGVSFHDLLPRNSSGKMMKRDIKAGLLKKAEKIKSRL